MVNLSVETNLKKSYGFSHAMRLVRFSLVAVKKINILYV